MILIIIQIVRSFELVKFSLQILQQSGDSATICGDANGQADDKGDNYSDD